MGLRILYLNHYAGAPIYGMEYRPFYLAREWVRAGHTVRMVSASFSHVRARQPALAPDRPVLGPVEVIDGIEYQWVPTPPYAGNGLGRVRNIVSFLARVGLHARRLAREFRPDVVIASSTYPMDIWPARRIARAAGARLVFEVHDLWPLSPIEIGGMSPRHPFIQVCSLAEGTAYRESDTVISMLPHVHEYMASRGLDLARLQIVPNGVSLEEWGDIRPALDPSVAKVVADARLRGRGVIGYAGSHGLPNALDTLLDVAARMKDVPADFVLVGDGHEKSRLEKRVVDEKLSNVKMLPPVPKAQIPSFLEEVDVAYIGWQRLPIYRFGVAPNKLMDYMMAGCAVLHAIDAGNDPVASAGCGLTVAPDDPAAIAVGLESLLALTSRDRKEMGAKGREYVLKFHTYPVLAQSFLDAVAGRNGAD